MNAIERLTAWNEGDDTVPADDKIIAGHIDVAHALIAALWKANKP